jgi:hypothetical protein
MIVFGGIRFITSGAIPSEKNHSKEFIWGALWGLVLLLISYFILKNTNPELVTLRDPGGTIAGNTRKEIEAKTGKRVVSKLSAEKLIENKK